MAADFRAIRDVELALHVPVVGDAVSPFMTPPDTDPAALRAADSLLVLPSDPTAVFARWSSACARLGSDSDTNDKP